MCATPPTGEKCRYRTFRSDFRSLGRRNIRPGARWKTACIRHRRRRFERSACARHHQRERNAATAHSDRTSVHWDVETFDLAHDGKLLAFVTDEEGLSVLHVRDTTNGREMPLPHIPAGAIGGLRWHKTGHELGFSLNNSRGPGDCYSLDVANEKLERWTNSETAVKTESLLQAELIHWKGFDGKMVSGFLYKPLAKFAGKRPVLVVKI